MSPERWQQIESLYHAALELPSAQRAAFLAQACPDDVMVRGEVESLLASHEQSPDFIESPPSDIVAGMMAEEQSRSMIGRTLGHYRLASLLGAGGMGEVYRARDLRLDRDVAVKILPEHLATDAEALRRFEREAKAVAALSHPNILAIFDFGTEAGVNYAVMELLEGETLRARLQREQMGWREAAEIGLAIADGLAAAHAKGIIHRDLKPENIFLTASGVKILDFGIARVKRPISPDAQTLVTAGETTRHGLVMGTLGYMSPEQVKGETAEATSDIFSLGCVLYEMLAGERPFARGTTAEMIAAILDAEPPHLTQTVKNIPEGLVGTIQRCLRKAPSERYQSAHDLGFDLKSVLGGQSITAPVVQRLPRRVAARIGVVVLIVLFAVTAWLFWGGKRISAIDSLAILPLINSSADANLEYLSDGITESLINSLSQLPKLRVIARSTVFTYKNKEVDPRKIGKELNVGAILTGRLAQHEGNLSVQIDLVNASDGSQLWGERYSKKLADLSDVEEGIARRVTEKLRIGLSGVERQRLSNRYGGTDEAHLLYLKGRYYWNNWTGGEIQKGLDYFEQSLALNPNYAPAWVGLADAYYGLSGVYQPSKEMMPKVRAAALKALEIDDTLGEAHASLALVKGWYEWDWQMAEKEFKRAIELNPNAATPHWEYGLFLVVTGHPDDALQQLKLAYDLDPLSLSIGLSATWPYYYAPASVRQYDKAIEQIQKLIETNPKFPAAFGLLSRVYVQKSRFEEAIAAAKQSISLEDAQESRAILTIAYATAGRKAEAQKTLAEMLNSSKQKHLSPVHVARIYMALGNKQQAIVWLNTAIEEKEEEIALLKVDPVFDSLHSDPQFTEILQKLNLLP